MLKKRYLAWAFIFTAVISSGFVSASDNWWNADWAKRQEINITSAVSSILDDFPVYLNVSQNNFMQSDLDDLRFINGSCASTETLELDFEIENYTGSDAVIWLRIPALASGVNQICMYYNNSDSSNGEDAKSVWGDDHKMVLHLAQASKFTSDDSSLYGNNGSIIGTPVVDEGGAIDGAIEFNDTDDELRVGDTDDLSGFSELTLEAWFNVIGPPGASWGRLISKSNGASSEDYGLLHQSFTEFMVFRINTDNGETQIQSTSAFDEASNPGWHHLVGTWNGTDMTLYIDGVIQAGPTTKTGTLNDTGDSLGIGKHSNATNRHFNGLLDEVRISNISKGQDWINMTYQVVANQDSFVDFGTEEDVDLTPPNVSINFPSNTTYGPSDLTFVFNVTLNENGSVSYSLDGGINNVSMVGDEGDIFGFHFNGTNSSIADGTYTFSVYANDTSGNNNYSESVVFSFDGTNPLVTINQPENLTYNLESEILFNITTNENSFANYTLDGGINNVSMQSNGNMDFNSTNNSIADGSYLVVYHVWDSLGNLNNSESTSFTVDQTGPMVNASFPLNVTYNSSDFPLLFNVTLNENGSVSYSLDGGINNFSMTGNEGFYGTSFNATNASLADGSYIFSVYANDTFGNVNYSETVAFSVNTSTDSGGESSGGGGGGGGSAILHSFGISPDRIDIRVKQGDNSRVILNVENTGNSVADFELSLDNLSDYVIIDNIEFSLEEDESLDVNVDFFVGPNEPAHVHAGRIVIVSEGTTKYVNVIFEVVERTSLFDITSELLEVEVNETLRTTITMIDVGDLEGNVDVTLEYFIEDFSGQKIKIEEETLAVDGQLIIEREFDIPDELLAGEYIFSVTLNYLGSIATSANRFLLVDTLLAPLFGEIVFSNFVYGIIVGILVTSILLVFVILKRNFSPDRFEYQTKAL